MKPRSMARSAKAFTLIEVLVVVAIIALLISILMPSLKTARRQARAVTCLSQIAQLVRGMSTYAHDCRGKYAPHLANGASQIQFKPEMAPWPDYRRIAYERFAAKQTKLLWCPLIPREFFMQPENSAVTELSGEDRDKWSKVYFVATLAPNGNGWGGQPSYTAGYTFFAGLTTNPKPKAGEPGTYSKFFDWSKSGNKSIKEEPREMGSTRDAVIADINESWPLAGYGTPLKPYRSFHTGSWASVSGPAGPGDRFIDSNVGFGDGSAEARKKLRNYVGRDGTGSGATGCYSY